MSSLNDVSASLKKIVSKTSQLMNAVAVLDISRENQRINHCDNVILYGRPGVGKSHLIKGYKRIHSAYDEDGKTIVPVVVVSLTGKTTHLACIQEILYEMGDPLWDKGTGQQSLKKLYGLLRDNGVQMVVIDEAHNTLNSVGINKYVAMTLRGIINNTNTSIVLAGTERVVEYRSDKELKRRFQRVVYLDSLCYRDSVQKEDFKTLVSDMVKVLPVSNKKALSQTKWLDRIFLATEGRPDLVYILFSEIPRQLKGVERDLSYEDAKNICLGIADLISKACVFEYSDEQISKIIRKFRDTKGSTQSVEEIIRKLLEMY